MVIRTFRELSFQVPRYSMGVVDEGSLAISINPLRLAFPGLHSEPANWSGSTKKSQSAFISPQHTWGGAAALHIHISFQRFMKRAFLAALFREAILHNPEWAQSC